MPNCRNDIDMALATCPGCGTRTTPSQAFCPQCGRKRRRSKLPIVAAVIGGYLALHFGINLLSMVLGDPKPAAPDPVVLAAAAKPVKDPAQEKRLKMAVFTLTFIKTKLRDPDSVKWEHVRVDDAATVVCVEYRARNGFGGMNREQATYTKGQLSGEVEAWNKHCAGKSLQDLDYVGSVL